ncbi:acyl-ACP desaturase [Tumebacillus algifaecis]|uniref:Acyl-ACP desaturase n=1 Tax=Tumebacillus algifaecis TaxID=1214604 RepID=A0A223D6S4_9BACL|nr:acyl-ACP desaturase [Tumebacillus algifaecis]ASS77187.1 acyl-ACP desaturase [Tumebacillus algifaecis]
MLLPNLDVRLERKIIDLYEAHKKRAANIDWSYHEFVPWELGRSYKEIPWSIEQVTLPPAVSMAIETALLTEVNLPWFTTYLSSTFTGSLDVMKEFIHTWVAEEDQHSNLLETYLLLTRNANPDQLHKLRKTVVESGFESSFTTPLEAITYASFQELATLVFYTNVSKVAAPYDETLAALLRRLAKDESLHYAFYRDVVMAHLELEPNYLMYVAPVLLGFFMPGNNIPNYDERMKVIAKEVGYGPSHYYSQVVMKLVEYWNIKDLRPTTVEAEKARLDILKYCDRLERISRRLG